MLGTVNVVLVTKDTIMREAVSKYGLPRNISSRTANAVPPLRSWARNVPDGHSGTGNAGQLDGTRETLVTLGVIVLQTDLELDGLEEVPLLLIERVVQQLLDILAHSGCSTKVLLVSCIAYFQEHIEEQSYRL